VNEGDEVTISCQTPANKSVNSNQKPVFVKSLSSDVEVEEGESVIISCTSQQTQQTPSQQEQFSPPKFVKGLSYTDIQLSKMQIYFDICRNYSKMSKLEVDCHTFYLPLQRFCNTYL